MTEAAKPLTLDAPTEETRADRIKIAEWCEREAALERGANYGSDREASGWVDALTVVAEGLRASLLPPTIEAKRKRLRVIMLECPTCAESEADDIADADLDGWLDSHRVEHK